MDEKAAMGRTWCKEGGGKETTLEKSCKASLHAGLGKEFGVYSGQEIL